MRAFPDRSEASDYQFRYIDLAPPGDVCALLEAQHETTLGLLQGVSDEQSLRPYAAGKWCLRELINHLSDSERTFAYRAMWFARGFDSELPGFDQEVAALGAAAARQSWPALLGEFDAVRRATIALFRGLPHDAWDRGGMAGGDRTTVRAFAYLIAGHTLHHLSQIRERYLPAGFTAHSLGGSS
ncbi:MAG: DinB family protein [Gemmatimonadales bacterium]